MSESKEHSTKKYWKIYWTLLVLLILSVLGPEIGIKWVTLIAAFGIAIVKAYMVCAYFMHLNTEKKYIWYLLSTALFIMLVAFTGMAPEVMKNSGERWEKTYVDVVDDPGSHGDAHSEESHEEDDNGGEHH